MSQINVSVNSQQVKDADHCVMCGLCLPHCPTYQLFQQEADSPRGRISLIRALATEQISPDETLVEHLEGCLMCHRCETVCPSQVPFSRLMDRARQELFINNQSTHISQIQLPRWLRLFTYNRRLRRFSKVLFWIYQQCGLRSLFHKIHLLHLLGLEKLDAMLPHRLPWLAYRKKPIRAKSDKQAVALFTGCVGEILDSETLNSASKLLHTAGFEVAIPFRQNCCGAMHQHSGDKQSAETLLKQNTTAFENTPTVISCASGCGIQLAEHATQLGISHCDINSFLFKHSESLRFQASNTTVTLHTPCTMQNNDDAKLLSLIPKLKVQPLTEQPSCCGAAGAHMLTHPTTANALLEPLLDALIQQKTNILLTANVGCALHFRRGLAQHNSPVEVMHPISWLSRHLL